MWRHQENPPLRRTLGSIFTVWHVLLAAGKWNYLSIPSFLAVLRLQTCAPGVLWLSYLFNQHLLSLLLSWFIPASAHQPLCIFILLKPLYCPYNIVACLLAPYVPNLSCHKASQRTVSISVIFVSSKALKIVLSM